MDLGLRRRELHLESYPVNLREFLLLKNRFQVSDHEVRQLSNVVNQSRLGERYCDVVSNPLLYRLNNNRLGRVRLGDCHTHAFGFELSAQNVEQIARAEDLQR